METIGLTLSPRPRRRIPALASLIAPGYLGEFATMYAWVVGLHIHGNLDAAKIAYSRDTVLELARDLENEIDPNAVCCYIPTAGGEPQQLLGFLGSESAERVADALAGGAILSAVPTGRPKVGANARGGTMPIVITLDA